MGSLTDRLVELRETAGKDTAEGLLYKTLANTVYGTFASPFLPTSNPVAGNVITGTARALAFAMTQSLNALTVITDGVLYRRDRIPAGTFAALLKQSSDYPLLHAADQPFLDPNAIPHDDAAFTRWYVDHVLRFFKIEGKPDYEALFRLHALTHKALPEGGVAFDGVTIDGSANYIKLVRTEAGKWRVVDMKARGFAKAEKKMLDQWLCRVYMRDRFTEPPPPVPSGRFLNVRDALGQAGRLVTSAHRVIVPLGLKLPTITTYKLIKPSAFVFRNARQRARVLIDWQRLNRKTECGPELLALRRTYGGSLEAVARNLFKLIRDGQERLNDLNVDKLWRPGSEGLRHSKLVGESRESSREEFAGDLCVEAGQTGPLTGLLVNRQSLAIVRSATDIVR